MSLILRRDKGSKLTITELDNNFDFLSKNTGDLTFTGLTMSSQILDKDVTLVTKGEGSFVIENDNNGSWALNLGIKFNSSDNNIWGSSVTTDDSGNTYTTGGDSDSARGFIIKTNHVGEVIWQKTITQYSYGESIVYKNGKLFTFLTEDANGGGILILKLDTDGNLLDQWSFQVADISDGNNANGYEIDVDDNENVYWTGRQYNLDTTSYDLVVGKLNTKQNLIDWSYLIDVSGNSDSGYSIKYKSGFIYITGQTNGFSFANIHRKINPILVIKLDITGTKIWDKVIAININYQQGSSITIDNENNVYVVGYKQGSLDNIGNFFLKLDSLGNIVWLKSFNFNQDIVSIDYNVEDNHLYISTSYNSDIFISKVSTNGEVVWQNIVGTNLDEYMWYNNGHKSVKVTNGQIYITGDTYAPDNNNSNMFLLSYNKDGMLPKTYGDWTVLSASFSFTTPINQLIDDDVTYGFTSSNPDLNFESFTQPFVKPNFKIIDSKVNNYGGTYSTVSYDSELTSFNTKKTQLKVKGEINVNDLYVMPESQGMSGEVLSYPETGNVLQWGKPGMVIATDDFVTPSTLDTKIGEIGGLTQIVGQYETNIVTLTNFDLGEGGYTYTIHRRINDTTITTNTFNWYEEPHVRSWKDYGFDNTVDLIYSDNYTRKYKITCNNYNYNENAVVTIEAVGISASIVTYQGYAKVDGFDDDFVEINLKDYPYYPYTPASNESLVFKSGFNDAVRTTHIQSDGKILVGGYFTKYNYYENQYINSNRITRLNSDGSPDKSFNVGDGFNERVITINQQTDGKILVGGGFDRYKGITQSKICRLNSDGSIDTTFNSGTGFTGEGVTTIEVQPDGKILVGGAFDYYNGTSANKIIRLNSDGTPDSTFVYGLGFDELVWTIKYLSVDKILVGGNFHGYNNNESGKLILLNLGGTIDTTFSLDGAVKTIEEQTDGRILVGGDFTNFNGYGVGCFVRLLPYAHWSYNILDFAFNLGNNTNFNAPVFTVKQQTDGKIVLGGQFTSYYDPNNGWASCPCLVRLNYDGTFDQTFNSNNLNLNSEVYTLSIQSDNKIIVGGNFTNYSQCLIRLYSGLEVKYFSPKFLGETYDKIAVGSNSYLTFGGGSFQFNDLSENNPNLPGIFIGADDRSYQRVWAGAFYLEGLSQYVFKVRYEGGEDTNWSMSYSPQRVWEICFFDEQQFDQPTIVVQIGDNIYHGLNDGRNGMSVIKANDHNLKTFEPINNSSFTLPQGWGLKETKYETIKFNPGTTIEINPHTKISEVNLPVAAADYQMNSGNVWGIRTYNGAYQVQLSSGNPVTWFNFTDIPGYVYSNLRGGIIEYHAFVSGSCNGTIIGSMTFVIDSANSAPIHTENKSGDTNLMDGGISLWYKGNQYANPGSIQAQDGTGGTTNLMIQWTSRLFFGNDCWCQ